MFSTHGLQPCVDNRPLLNIRLILDLCFSCFCRGFGVSLESTTGLSPLVERDFARLRSMLSASSIFSVDVRGGMSHDIQIGMLGFILDTPVFADFKGSNVWHFMYTHKPTSKSIEFQCKIVDLGR